MLGNCQDPGWPPAMSGNWQQQAASMFSSHSGTLMFQECLWCLLSLTLYHLQMCVCLSVCLGVCVCMCVGGEARNPGYTEKQACAWALVTSRSGSHNYSFICKNPQSKPLNLPLEECRQRNLPRFKITFNLKEKLCEFAQLLQNCKVWRETVGLTQQGNKKALEQGGELEF